MAIFDGKFLKGILGDFIFKVVDGVQVVSKRPVSGTMKQSVETKKSSANFRKSSMPGKRIRGIFHNTLGGMIIIQILHRHMKFYLESKKKKGSKFTSDPSYNIVCYLIAIGQLSIFY